MSYIYKISNDINDKLYIGKTCYDIQKRFKEHCKDAFKPRNEKRPLYSAMVKYGIENFHIDVIEECPDDKASDRESYWIGCLETYSNGYNATAGGDGQLLYNHEDIANALKINPYSKEVAEQFGCCVDIVYDIAKQYQIKTQNKGHMNVNKAKQIVQLNKQGEQLRIFSSTAEAAKWCFENDLCITLNSGVCSHISACANGQRKTAYGYHWKYC